MKLTNADRKAFVRAVMDDVPKLDYDKAARNLVEQEVKENLPPGLRIEYDEHKHYFYDGFVGLPGTLANLHVHGALNYILSGPLRELLLELDKEKCAQTEKLKELEGKLTALIGSCSTLKQAQATLPEFVKYLPQERKPTTPNLPVVSNIVADLTRAGWPKGE